MSTALVELVELTGILFWQGFAVFLRVGAMVALLPAFGERTVPNRIKLAIILAFVFVVAPAVPGPATPAGPDSIAWLAMTEVVAGAVLGIGIRLFVLALQTAGSIAAQSTSLAQILGGAAADPLPAMGYILIIGGLALAVITGLHVKAAELLILSYEVMPMGAMLAGPDVSEWGVSKVAQAFALAFTLAAPFVLVALIYNVTLGVINKAMPQLMVAFVGAPVITAGGLFILFLAAPFMLSQWMAAVDAYLLNPYRVTP